MYIMIIITNNVNDNTYSITDTPLSVGGGNNRRRFSCYRQKFIIKYRLGIVCFKTA